MNSTRIGGNLYFLPLPQKIIGFQNFISTWLYWDEAVTFIVDPGPLCSVDYLLDELKMLGVARIDYVLLTHIHIDHAGGTGKLVESFPGVKVVCHLEGIPHLVDPSQVWEGSKAVLGDIASAYGEFVPVPAECVIFENTIGVADETIQVLKTPGHAPHHLCFAFEEILFAGELAGVYQAANGSFYCRPATPPVFKLPTALESIERVLSLNPRIICYGHYGISREGSYALQVARDQLVMWAQEIKTRLVFGEASEEEVIGRLLSKDRHFAKYELFEDEAKQRELFFIHTTINGIKQYIESLE